MAAPFPLHMSPLQAKYNLKELIETKDFPERQNRTDQWRLEICQELLLGLQELTHTKFCMEI
ncbi:hypothetical protein CCH79_00017640 [Gambusia affinis]|uniref:Uncharacterized protein n=1 Tax=Gambusia affinis TaxID=33528 RepID=A0A315W180_GAMAF|nr:hypothetical protein CCH79_00017640 [Gambusia affinis]